jgi:hypothetical protein
MAPPFGFIDVPVRRARALGAFTSVEICMSGTIFGRTFLQAVERALAASPGQVCLSDGRSRGVSGAEWMEKAGELCASAGLRRVCAWTWAKGEGSFDSFGILLSGQSVSLGPGAVNCRPEARRTFLLEGERTPSPYQGEGGEGSPFHSPV